MLTNYDEVCIQSLSSILLAVIFHCFHAPKFILFNEKYFIVVIKSNSKYLLPTVELLAVASLITAFLNS